MKEVPTMDENEIKEWEMARRNLRFDNDRSGPCEDDWETNFRNLLPDESEHEGGSPLNFKYTNNRRMEEEEDDNG